jgi:hypothetical protein
MSHDTKYITCVKKGLLFSLDLAEKASLGQSKKDTICLEIEEKQPDF